jgi:hypothetical protein
LTFCKTRNKDKGINISLFLINFLTCPISAFHINTWLGLVTITISKRLCINILLIQNAKIKSNLNIFQHSHGNPKICLTWLVHKPQTESVVKPPLGQMGGWLKHPKAMVEAVAKWRMAFPKAMVEGVCSCYYALRKRICHEPFN